MTCRTARTGMVALAAGFALSTAAVSDDPVTVDMEPSKDATLIEHPDGGLALGSAEHFYVGRVGVFGGGTLRRGVIAFDVASEIPCGSVITEVTLQLYMSMTNTGTHTVTMRRLTSDWGEGASSGTGGVGVPAQPGDATWLHTFYPDEFWNTPGGDFVDVVSSEQQVGSVGFYTWPSTPQLVADVQGWIDDAETNYGWILRGNEAVLQTAQQYASRENSNPALRPMLTVTYEPGDCPEACPWDLTGDGQVDGADLGQLLASWGPCRDCNDCPPDFDGNCEVDGADLGQLLANWGDCPEE